MNFALAYLALLAAIFAMYIGAQVWDWVRRLTKREIIGSNDVLSAQRARDGQRFGWAS